MPTINIKTKDTVAKKYIHGTEIAADQMLNEATLKLTQSFTVKIQPVSG